MAHEVIASITVPAVPERLHELREVVRDSAQSLDFGEGCAMDLMLAVNEACMNVIQHGYRNELGEIKLDILALSGGIEFRITDTAPRVDLSVWRPRDLKDIRPGGLGVHFIREIIDEVSYLPIATATGNCLSLKKYRSRCKAET